MGNELNEFSDMVLSAAYLADKAYQKFKKRKKLRLRKRVMKKENTTLDVYLEHIQEGFFGDLNCKRMKSSLKVITREMQDHIDAYKKHCGKTSTASASGCEALKNGAIGLRGNVDRLKAKIKQNCSN